MNREVIRAAGIMSRAIDAYGNEIRKAEQARIIALLEEEASANDAVNNPYDAGYIRALIGLIKNDYENVIKDKETNGLR